MKAQGYYFLVARDVPYEGTCLLDSELFTDRKAAEARSVQLNEDEHVVGRWGVIAYIDGDASDWYDPQHGSRVPEPPKDDEPRAWTSEELCTTLIDHFYHLVQYWYNVDIDDSYPKDKDPVLYRLEGVVFSVLAALDGSCIDIPAYDLVARPHPSDKDYLISNGENWIEEGTTISTMLHELFSCKK